MAAVALASLGLVAVPTRDALAEPAPVATDPAAPAEQQAAREGLVVTGVALARIAPDRSAHYLAPAAQLTDVAWSDRLRVRFRVHNPLAEPLAPELRLEYRREGDTGWAAVPDRWQADAPMRIDPERVAAPHRGLRAGPASAPIAPDALRIPDDATDLALVEGRRYATDPASEPLTIPPLSATEVEFSVHVTMDAARPAAYEVRLSAGGDAARIETAPVPEPRLTPRPDARAATAPVPRTAATSGTIRYRLVPAAATSAGAKTANAAAAGTLSAAALAGGNGPHGPYTSTDESCASCHRSHAAQGKSLLPPAGPQATLCLTCHDGTGASSNVSAEYSDATVPANNAADRAYYRHDALTTSGHTLAGLNEFQGVSDRHSECGDCHDPHKVTAAPSKQTTAGWTAGGMLAGISGAAVTARPAGAAPTYSFVDGDLQPVDLEYQLCLKCHSGFTKLGDNTGFTPSRYVLDKGHETDPANASFHPVAAPGTNKTAKMDAQLAGTSPYKQWTFTSASTIRCTSCHAGAGRYNATLPPNGSGGVYDPPAAAGTLPPHTSKNRSLLILPYRDRLLKGGAERYNAADFALCYACHGEQPFANQTSTATNFRLHGMHITGIGGSGTTTPSIDTVGAGQGNAICAECHFRLHSSEFPDPGQTLNGQRLVNFAPNVRPNGSGTRSWTKTATGGSCTLTCHGQSHSNEGY